jgi:hypothetical protein
MGVLMEHIEKKAIESREKWYKAQPWYLRLIIIFFNLEEVYEGAYCDGWVDCCSHSGCSISDLQELKDIVEDLKRESGPVALLSMN